MNIFQNFKRFSLIYNFNSFIKRRQQEQYAASELYYYRNEASLKGIIVLKDKVFATVLKKRLKERGIYPIPKLKGDLHIFCTFPINDWESVLPISLAPFGKVTTFEWRCRGFNDKSFDWIEQREVMNKEMLEIFKKEHTRKPIDVVVGYLSGNNTNPELLKEMSNAGAVIINFNWDDKLHFRGKMYGGRWTGPAALASVVDLNLTNSPDSLIKYMVEGGLAMFWPEAAHPDIHKPYDLPFKFDVSFVGGKYGWRPNFIEKLQKMDIKVTCFGNGWENGPLSDDEIVKLYSRSRINLGFAGVGHSKKLMCLKGRDFEIPMSGGLYLTQDNPELSLVYDVVKEIVTYRDEKDCARKIRWLLQNPGQAEKIRKDSRVRSLKDHTWEKRFSSIFRIAGLLKDD